MMGIGIHVQPGCNEELPDDTDTMNTEESMQMKLLRVLLPQF
jgi:hypothetical protein